MNLMNDSYDFVNNLHASVRSLIPVIATHCENLVGAEIGVWKGDSFLTLLQNCPNIKTLHGVDFYEEFCKFKNPKKLFYKYDPMHLSTLGHKFVYNRINNIIDFYRSK